MLSLLIRRIAPVLLLGGLTLSSCVVHEHDYGHRGRDYRPDRGYHRGYSYGHDRGHGRY